jgi:uncharacterized protein YecE (DUF72 family)
MDATLDEKPGHRRPAAPHAGRGAIRIGVSGWTYPPWRGHFYPKGLRQKDELAFAAGAFSALEINGTFYGLQTPKSFGDWAAAVPPDFVFAVKGPRFITHLLRGRNTDPALANFFASGILALGHHLGAVLWQFPPNFRFEAERMEAFLDRLPRTGAAAARLGARHDQRLRSPAFLDVDPRLGLRHAIEIRPDSFRDPAFITLLRKQQVALVVADTVEWPLLMDLTADFVYCRLHGSTELYRSAYAPEALDRWAARIAAWSSGAPMTDGNFVTAPVADGRPRDVFLFFDNTDKLQAPGDARALMARLGVAPAGNEGATP